MYEYGLLLIELLIFLLLVAIYLENKTWRD